MPTLARRAALAAPLLLLAAPAWARIGVPPFPEWIGRTAKLKGDSGQARLLLQGDRRSHRPHLMEAAISSRCVRTAAAAAIL